MKQIILFFTITISLLSSSVEVVQWKDGWTFLEFLQREGLPESLYYNADYADRKAIEDIQARSRCYVLRDVNGTLKQVLIPLSEELQIHIYKREGSYFLENIPIEFEELDKKFVAKIVGSSVYNDIKKITNSSSLASFFVKILKDRVNFRQDIHKGSIVSMLYKRKYRLGYPFGGIDLKIAMLETGNRKRYVINFMSKNYNAKGEYVEKQTFIRPVKNGTYWVSSKFTKKRWHPILKKYRAHLGIDYAANRGTAIYSAGDGKIAFAYKTRGYGNLIKVKHKGGYLTLYAHLKNFRKGLKVGMKVKKGEYIGNVGTTGLSTGPHLHFGLYKDGIAKDPETVVSIETTNIVENRNQIDFKEFRDAHKEQMGILVKDFKSGRFITEQYIYEKLVSETTLTNIDGDDNPFENRTNQVLLQEEQIENMQYIFGNRKLRLYDVDDELELSEDYQLY